MAKTSKYSEAEFFGHIVEFCETIQQEIADVTFDDFLTDCKLGRLRLSWRVGV